MPGVRIFLMNGYRFMQPFAGIGKRIHSMTIDSARFTFLGHALHGTGGFRTGDQLIRYPRESDDKYLRRKEVAWYANPMMRACSRYVGYLGRKQVVRDTADNELLQAFRDDANWKGDALDVVFKRFMLEAKARGCMLMLIDMPKKLPPNKSEQIQQRAFPYLVPIAPERVTDYQLNERGQLSSVSVKDTAMDADGKPIHVIRTWDEHGWRVEYEGETLEQGPHLLGVCPIIAFSESGDFPSEGEFSPIADLAKRQYNMQSELDELLRGQTFSILAYHVPGEAAHLFEADQVAATVSTNNMLVHYGDRPGFISPESSPTEAYFKSLDMIAARIDEIGLDVQPPDAQESGIAMEIRFQLLNSSLTSYARTMEDFERRIWDLVCAWLNIANRVQVSWPKDFSIADLTRELDVYERMSSNDAPASYRAAKLRQIVALDMSGAEPDVLESINAEIEQMTHERGGQS